MSQFNVLKLGAYSAFSPKFFLLPLCLFFLLVLFISPSFASTAQQLGVVNQPSTTFVNGVITGENGQPVRVEIQDSSGNRVNNADREVVASIENNAGPGQLSGTRTVTSSGGVAVFDDLRIDRPGEGYTLLFETRKFSGVPLYPVNGDWNSSGSNLEGLDEDISDSFDIIVEPGIYVVTVYDPEGGTIYIDGVAAGHGDTFVYSEGTEILLEAEAEDLWEFDRWGSSVSGTTPTKTLVVDSDKQITANFEQHSYQVNLQIIGDGLVVVDGDTYTESATLVVDLDDNIDLQAVPEQYWNFYGWDGDLDGSQLEESLFVDENKQITAIFVQDNHTLRLDIQGSGTIVFNGGTYNESLTPVELTVEGGEQINLDAIASSGWDFYRWQGDLTSSSTSEQLLIDGDKEITAVFHGDQPKIHLEIIGQGVVNIDGTDYSSSTVIEIPEGETVDLEAIAADYWAFEGWEQDLSGTDQQQILTVDTDKYVTARFVHDTYTLILDIVGEGTVYLDGVAYPEPQLVTVPAGSTLDFEAVADNSWEFIEWQDDLTSSNPEEQLYFNSDKQVTAFFQEVSLDLTVEIVGEGTVFVDGNSYTQSVVIPIDEGEELNFESQPAEYYSFFGWEEDLTGTDFQQTLQADTNLFVRAIFQRDTHILTVDAEGEGKIVVAGDSYWAEDLPETIVVDSGLTLDFEAIAADNWYFANWTGDLTGTTRQRQLLIDSDKSLSAIFDESELTLQLDIIGDGAVHLRGTTYLESVTLPIEEGETLEFTAHPEDYVSFSGWSGDLTGTALDEQLTVTGNQYVAARFIRDTYILTVDIEGRGSVAVDGEVYSQDDLVTQLVVSAGQHLDFQATAASYWSFVEWTGNITGSNPDEQLFIDGDKTVTAHFEHDQYRVAVDVDGLGDLLIDGQLYENQQFDTEFFVNGGDQLDFEALPAIGWSFVRWEDDLSGSSASEELYVDSDKQVVAIFEERNYTLTVNIEGQGTVDLEGTAYPTDSAPLTLTVPAGETLELEAIESAADWSFVGWCCDLSSTEFFETITVDADKEVTANFQAEQYTLTIDFQGAGEIDIDGVLYSHEDGLQEITVSAGDQLDFIAIPATGWEFDEWQDDLTGTLPEESLTIDSNHHVTAVFERETYNLMLDINGQGSVEINGQIYTGPEIISVDYGTELEFIADPDEGWNFSGWEDDLTGHNLEEQLEVVSNHAVTANFQQITEYNLLLDIVGQGSVNLQGDSYTQDDVTETFTFQSGTTIDLSAIAHVDGWSFIEWEGDLLGPQPVQELFMNSDKHTTAVFGQPDYTLIVDMEGDGVVVVDGETYTERTEIPVFDGQQLDFQAVSGEGWFFDRWQGDLIGSDSSQLLPIDGNKEVVAHFDRYNLTLDIVGEGAVVVDGETHSSAFVESVDPGQNIEFVAIPEEGWSFDRWSNDLDGSDPEESLYIDSSKSVQAIFVRDTYSLTIDIEGQGTVTARGDSYRPPDVPKTIVVNAGETVDLEAIADQYWNFDRWTGDLSGSNPARQIVVDSNKSVTAHFRDTFILTVDIVGEGYVVVDGETVSYQDAAVNIPVDGGQTVNLEAIPEEYWEFIQWTGDLSGSNPDGELYIDSDKSVTAHFEEEELTLTIDIVGQGSVVADGETYTFPTVIPVTRGQVVDLGAFPADGWFFDRWEDDLSGSNPDEEILIDESKTVTAVFDRCALVLDIIGEGSVIVAGETYTHNDVPTDVLVSCSDSVCLEAIADTGWHFVEWRRDLQGDNPEESIFIDSSKEVTAVFARDTYTLTIDIEGEGTAVADGESYRPPDVPETIVVEYGQEIDFDAFADSGWFFEGWSGDLTGSNPEQSLIIDSNKHVTAHFVDTFVLEIDIVGEGIVTVGGEIDGDTVTPDNVVWRVYVEPGTTVDLEAIAAEHWHFDRWTGDLWGSNPNREIYMDSNKSVTAHFKEDTFILRVDIIGEGNVVVDGEEYTPDDVVVEIPVVAGQTIDFEAIADEYWYFDRWTGDLGGSDTETSLFIDSDKNVTAVFDQYQLIIDIVGDGNVVVDGETHSQRVQKTVKPGATIELDAFPEEYWQFIQWTGDINSPLPEQDLYIDSDKHLTAHFERDTYTLIVDIVGEGTVDVDTETLGPPDVPREFVVEAGQAIDFEAIADQNWHFEGWTGDLGGDNPEQQLIIDSDKHVTAHFSDSYTLLVDIVGEGTVDVDGVSYGPDDVVVEIPVVGGQLVDLDAIEVDGWYFTGWTGDLSGDENSQQLLIDSNKSVTAHFQDTFILIVDIVGEGYVLADGQLYSDSDVPVQIPVAAGSTVNLDAFPEDLWNFVEWTGDLSGSRPDQQLFFDSDKHVIANFTPDTYTLTIDIVGEGFVNAENTIYDTDDVVVELTVSAGDSFSLDAFPADYYSFVHWSGDLQGPQSAQDLFIDGDKQVTAHFQRDTYILEIDIKGSGMVDADGELYDTGDIIVEKIVDAGQTVDLTAIAAANWRFVNWSGDLTTDNPEEQIYINSDKHVTAHFTDSYILQLDIVGEGMVIVDGETYLPEDVLVEIPVQGGDLLDFEAIAADNWSFVEWSVDLSGSALQEQLLIDSDKKVVANFQRDTYIIELDIEGAGTVELDGTLYTVEDVVVEKTVYAGQTIEFEATADDYWYFVEWSGDLTGTELNESLVVDGNKQVTAHFGRDSYILTIDIEGQGAIDLDQDLYTVDDVLATRTVYSGEIINFEAIADTYWQFSNWSGDLSTTSPQEELLITSDKTVVANFIQDELTVILDIEGRGTVEFDGTVYDQDDVEVEINVLPGETIDLVADPAADWHFIGWTGDLSGDTPVRQLYVDSNKHVTANFGRDSYILEIDIQGQGMVEAGGQLYTVDQVVVEKTVYAGETIALEAIAADYWEFIEWSGDLTGNSVVKQLLIDGNKQVTAHFAAVEYTVLIDIAGEGTIEVDNQSFTHEDVVHQMTVSGGETVLFEAFDDLTWQFTGWSGDLSGSNLQQIVYVDQDKAVTAVFEYILYDLIVNIEGEGSVLVDGDTVSHSAAPFEDSFEPGENIELEAISPQYWSFSGWTGDLTGASPTGSLTMDQNREVTAHFTRDTYIISLDIEGEGAVNLLGETYTHQSGTVTIVADAGDFVNFRATPSDYWIFSEWQDDIQSFQPEESLFIDGNKSVTAIFVEDLPTYILTIEDPDSGTILVNGEPAADGETFDFDPLTEVDLELVVDHGYEFEEWLGDIHLFIGDTFSRTMVIRMTDNATISAKLRTSGSAVIGGSSYSGGLNSLMVGPNPFNSSTDDLIRFQFEVTQSERFLLEIFTISGNLVYQRRYGPGDIRSFSDKNYLEWDLSNNSGHTVSSGHYLYNLRDLDAGDQQSGRIAIIR